MLEWLKGFIAKRQEVKQGAIIWAYFPELKKHYKVIVSSVKMNTFAAKFPDEEPDDLDCWKLYGQMDNDIIYSLETKTPVDMRKK